MSDKVGAGCKASPGASASGGLPVRSAIENPSMMVHASAILVMRQPQSIGTKAAVMSCLMSRCSLSLARKVIFFNTS